MERQTETNRQTMATTRQSAWSAARRPSARATLRVLALVASIGATVATRAGATIIPAREACPNPAVAQLGTTGADKLRAGRTTACLLADEGADRLKGSREGDTLDPGPGIDRSIGGGGDDVIVIRGACEVGRGEILKGGGGTDTVRSPLTRIQLEALGVKLRGVETFETIVGANDGACTNTDDGVVCTCCNKPGFDETAGCTGCSTGFLLDDPRGADGDMVGAGLEEASCNAVPTCSDMNCGAHGECLESAAHGPACDCEQGYAGLSCEACAPPYQLTGDGRCVLGRDCGAAMCGGHGECVADAEGRLSCDCDAGFDADADCGGPDLVVGGLQSVVPGGGPYTYGLLLHNGSHCTTDFTWSVTGGGSIEPHAADSTRATYTPPSVVDGHVDVAEIRAECGNNDELGGTFDVSVTAGGVGAPDDGNINGNCDEKLAPFDEVMLEWLAQQGIEGGTLAVTYQEQVLCLRGYGNRRVSAASSSSPMKQCTPLRVASVSKPFTRAALRGNLFGNAIAPELGGGFLGEETPMLPILASTMELGPGGEVTWQADDTLYADEHPTKLGLGIPCSTSDGLINSNWNNVTLRNMLAHTAGFAPNQKFAFSPGTGGCTEVDGEVCGDTNFVGDPTITAITRMANDLGLGHGTPTIDDVVRWAAGTCPYAVADTPMTPGPSRYSNLGFTVAGKVVEKLTGLSYESFVTNFLAGDEAIGLDLPGSPIVYQGRSGGGGPAGFFLPAYMPESDYYTWRGEMVDVTTPVLGDVWTFPNTVEAPYGGASFEAMGPHGGLVMNALGLANFGSNYLVKDGTARALGKGGPGMDVYYPTDRGISHAGLLFGTSALIWELPSVEPNNNNNPNGVGCLVPGDKQDIDDPANGNGLNALDVVPCPTPPGIRVSVIFNGEQRSENDAEFIRGRHDWALLAHMLRKAAADVGATAADWDSLLPLTGDSLRIGCDLECFNVGVCAEYGCGDGVVEGNEECDDGDNEGGDACEPDCKAAPTEPGGYDDCEGEDPGSCLGGPCAPRDFVSDLQTDLLDPYSEVHPDGDWSPNTFCHDSHTSLGAAWEEATCVRTTILDKVYGVCLECGVGTMVGCTCPAPNLEDGGCNIDGVSTGLDCVGGRCWEDLPPEWMCTADCDNDIYGAGGFCRHDDPKGAVCYNEFCDEPEPPGTGYCSDTLGQVCDANVDGCDGDSCCEPECLNDAKCEEIGYSPGHICVDERCVLN